MITRTPVKLLSTALLCMGLGGAGAPGDWNPEPPTAAASAPAVAIAAAPYSVPTVAVAAAPAVAVAVAIAADATPTAADAAKGKCPAFKPVALDLPAGERLTFDVKWGAICAGQAVMSVRPKEQLGPGGPEVWRINCRTRSNAFVSAFYEVRDDITSLLDAKEGFARLFEMDKNEGPTHRDERVEFDYDRNQAKYLKTNTRKPGDTTSTKTVSLPGKVHDPFGCLYYMRGLDLQVGKEYQLTVNTSQKNWLLNLKVLRRESMEVEGVGRVRALVIEPEAQFDGIFVSKGKMTVWLEERTKVPLKLQAKLPIGSASAVLVKAENSPLSRLGASKP
jgi:hypothetical protein